MSSRLEIHLYGVVAATLEYVGPSSYKLAYLSEFQESGFGSLSLSLPVTERVHTGRLVYDFIDNLLPDSVAVREEWARQSGLPDAEPFSLLARHGADVAGAVEFYPEGEGARSTGTISPVSDAVIAERIEAIRANLPIPIEPDHGPGQFSLGGAQSKFAMALRDGEWFDPTGIHPSTHIFKPHVAGLDDAEIIEHITMQTMNLLQISSAATSVREFGSERSLVVTRFDRYADGDVISRIHQEDLVQASGQPRLRKCEKDGGPGIRQIIRILDQIPEVSRASAAKTRFIQSLIFSWMVLNTDAHAKNYSLTLVPGRVDLTPMYDASSFLPYVRPREVGRDGLLQAFDTTKLSMRIADSFEAGSMGAFEWQSVARDARVDAGEFMEWAQFTASIGPAFFAAVIGTLNPQFRTPAVLAFSDRLEQRFTQVSAVLDKPIKI